MFLKLNTQRTIEKTFVDDYLFSWMEAFLIDRKANGNNHSSYGLDITVCAAPLTDPKDTGP